VRIRHRLPILATAFVAFIVFLPGCFAQNPYSGTASDRDSLAKTGAALRAAFERGDIEAIMAYHHPDVIKALGSDRYLVGREAVKADLLHAFQTNRIEFKESRLESVFFQGDTAVEESQFTIQGTPKNGGAPFLFKGRSMVVYVRYKSSPTGWASIREIIQPAT
jgi:ketosteroid isomerase-like protein